MLNKYTKVWKINSGHLLNNRSTWKMIKTAAPALGH